jgi:hypothetical protein
MGRRVFEAASRNLPVVVLLFIPVLFRLPHIYHWAEPGVVAADPILSLKAGYLNVPFFIGRAVLYFLVWLFCTFMLNRYSAAQDRNGTSPVSCRAIRSRCASSPRPDCWPTR